MPDSIPLIAISVNQLTVTVIIVAIEVVGLTNYFGCFFGKRSKKFLVLGFTFICGIANTHVVSSLWTAVFDIVFLSLALATIAYDVIKDALPNLVRSVFNKAIDFKESAPPRPE